LPEIQFSSTAFQLLSTAFCFPQRLSAFLNCFLIFLNGFPLSKKSKKIYLRQQVSKRLLFEPRHLLSKLRNSCYNVYISPNSGWIIASTNVFYPDLGNTVTGSCHVITAVHSSSASTVDPLLLKRPPLVPPHPLGEFLWEPFNRPEHAISLTRDDADFGKQENPLTASSPASTQDNSTGIII
jgi:hypothetical protein